MTELSVGEHQFQLSSPDGGGVDATWLIAAQPVAQIILAHGAGASHRHATMAAIAEHFAAVGISSLRFNFPYMQAGKRRVDNKDITVRAIALAHQQSILQSALPLFLGGHSFGGRMSSHAVAELGLPCRGLIFCSFPLHQAKKPSRTRAVHLAEIDQPMLFLSGSRDDLADSDLLVEVVGDLNDKTRIHWLETANHGYVVLKRSRQNPLLVFEEMAHQARRFVDEVT